MDILTKRVYQQSDPNDGSRSLVDRVWPRGMTKEQVRADYWLKDVAPSAGLRKWFDHDRSKWGAFKRRYFLEPLDFIARLAALVPKPRVNLTRYHGVFAPNSQHRAQVTPARRGRGINIEE